MGKLLEKIGKENVDVIFKIRSMMLKPLLHDVAILAVFKVREKAFEYINNGINPKKKEMYIISLEFPSIIDLVYNITDDKWGDIDTISRINERISKYGVTVDDLFDKQLFDEVLNDFKDKENETT